MADNFPWNSTVGITLIFVAAIFIVTSIVRIYRIIKGKEEQSGSSEESFAPADGYYFYNGHRLNLSDTDIITILQKYFPYYNFLEPCLQAKFKERVRQFISVKTFIIPQDETYKEVPVLLSATAVQLTFGLDDFALSWFKYVQVHAEEYLADDPHAFRILAGHVEGKTITIAWNQFLNGVKDVADGINVGLHELAHALYYQHVVADNGREKIFIKELGEVMEEGEEVYELKKTTQVLFTDYAYKNLQEFWAESIEIFFEKPETMLTYYPALYSSIKELLNQDPINKSNPLLLN